LTRVSRAVPLFSRGTCPRANSFRDYHECIYHKSRLFRTSRTGFAKEISARERADARDISQIRAPADREQARERPWKTARFTAKIIPRRVRGRAGKTHASIRPAWSKKEKHVRTYAPARRTSTGRETCFRQNKRIYLGERAGQLAARLDASFSIGRIDQGRTSRCNYRGFSVSRPFRIYVYISLSLSLFPYISPSNATSRSFFVFASGRRRSQWIAEPRFAEFFRPSVINLDVSLIVLERAHPDEFSRSRCNLIIARCAVRLTSAPFRMLFSLPFTSFPLFPFDKSFGDIQAVESGF